MTTIDFNAKMTKMLEFSDQDFKAAIIQLLQQAIINILETLMNILKMKNIESFRRIESLWQINRKYKEELIRNFRAWKYKSSVHEIKNRMEGKGRRITEFEGRTVENTQSKKQKTNLKKSRFSETH